MGVVQQAPQEVKPLENVFDGYCGVEGPGHIMSALLFHFLFLTQ